MLGDADLFGLFTSDFVFNLIFKIPLRILGLNLGFYSYVTNVYNSYVLDFFFKISSLY
jgi:hypothetical protein